MMVMILSKMLSVVHDIIKKNLMSSFNMICPCKVMYFQIKKINSIWSYLNERVTETHITSLFMKPEQ